MITNTLTRERWIKEKMTHIRTQQKKLRHQWLDLDVQLSALDHELAMFFASTFKNIPRRKK